MTKPTPRIHGAVDIRKFHVIAATSARRDEWVRSVRRRIIAADACSDGKSVENEPNRRHPRQRTTRCTCCYRRAIYLWDRVLRWRPVLPPRSPLRGAQLRLLASSASCFVFRRSEVQTRC